MRGASFFVNEKLDQVTYKLCSSQLHNGKMATSFSNERGNHRQGG
jgi:hypothetical protein